MLCVGLRPTPEYLVRKNTIRTEMRAFSQDISFLVHPVSLPARTFASGSTPYTPDSIHPALNPAREGEIAETRAPSLMTPNTVSTVDLHLA